MELPVGATPPDVAQRAFAAAPDALLVHDDGWVLGANAAAKRLLGDDPVGRHLLDYVPEPERAALAHHLRGPGGPITTRLAPRGARSRSILLEAVPAEAGQPAVACLREAGANRGSRDRDAEVERLEQMNQFKTQLLNTAAHELNTPLTPLRLQVHLLRSLNLGGLTERQLKAVDVLERNVERLSVLVSDILDVARLESGHLRIEAEDTSLRELVVEAVQSYEETARGVGVDLVVQAEDEITVRADPRRIMQVLYNLVSNGIKFTPEGGRVTIRTGDDGPEAFVEVEDTGLGIDPAHQDRLFQPFSRVHDTDSTAIPGTGLGLYISKGIVEQSTGRLSVRSRGLGRGTTFRFTLPLVAAPVHHSRPRTIPKSPLVAGPLAQRLRELI